MIEFGKAIDGELEIEASENGGFVVTYRYGKYVFADKEALIAGLGEMLADGGENHHKVSELEAMLRAIPRPPGLREGALERVLRKTLQT